MIPLGIAAIVFACGFGGALGGMFLRTVVPAGHLTKETEDAVKLGMGMIATLTALIIGLLVASAKGSYDTKDAELRRFAANLILLDRQLAHYGPEARGARDLLRRYTVFKIDSTWPSEASHPVDDPDGWKLLEDMQDELRVLAPPRRHRGPTQCPNGGAGGAPGIVEGNKRRVFSVSGSLLVPVVPGSIRPRST